MRAHINGKQAEKTANPFPKSEDSTVKLFTISVQGRTKDFSKYQENPAK
jgi:hypothetical protein